MPKQIPKDLDDRIVSALGREPDGLEIKRLYTAFADMASRRTLLRRLADLIAAGKVVARGDGKARVYRAVGRIDVQVAGVAREVSAGVPSIVAYVPVSRESREIVAYVRRPIQDRTPIGYDSDLLESYRPNETFYLPPQARDHLMRIGRPEGPEQPAGTYARNIFDRLLIDLSWASSRLEGNTYTRLDTQNLIEFGREAEGKDRREAQMILNHKAAIELLVEHPEQIGFDTFTFFNLHALLSENLLANPDEGGRLRNRVVEVGGSVFHPAAVPQQIEYWFRMILAKADMTKHPFEQAFFIMVHIPYLQPFIDANKRVSRLGANVSLIKRNLCPLSFVDVPERAYVEGTRGVYEMGRIELLRDVFLWAYERSCRRYTAVRETAGEPDPFRLRYREALIAVVGNMVRGDVAPSDKAIRDAARSLVAKADLNRFVAMARGDLERLHEGNISRYRLRLSEYREWLRRRGGRRGDA